MKALIPILIGLLVVGCGKKEEEQTGKVGTTLEFARQPFLGIYESEDNRDWVYRFVLKEDGRYQCFANGLEMEGGTWKVVGKEVHVDGSVYTLNADNGLVNIAMIGTGIRDKGTREDYPTKEQNVFKKIKAETQPKTFKALKEEDVVGAYTRKYKDEEGAEILEKLIFLKNGSRDRYVNAEKAEATKRFAGYRMPIFKAHHLAEKQPPAWVFFKQPLNPISATKIRSYNKND